MKLNLLKQTGASAIVLMAAMLGASAGFAAPPQDQAILDAISFETQHKNLNIRVITTDGSRWDSIVEDAIPFEARSVVDTAGNGVIHNVGVTLGACAGLSCQGAPVVMSEATLKRDIDRRDNLEFSTVLIPVSTPEHKASIPLGDQLLSRCNEKLTDAGAVTSHAFIHDVPVTLVADTSRTNAPLPAYDPAPNQTGDAVAHADFARTNALKVRVVCDAGDGLAPDLLDGNEGEEVVADGGGLIPVEPDGGPGGAPVGDPPIGDPELPGGEEPPFDPGFPLPPVGDPVPNPLKVQGTLSLHELPNADQSKPRLGRGFFRIYTNKPGPTKWKLSCTGGRNWIGASPTVKVGAKVWRVIKMVNFQINKTELVKCKLRTRSKPGHPVIAQAKRLYKVLPGDLADPGGPLNVTGMLDLREFPNTDKTKPRNGFAKFSILTNKPGQTRWKLKCNGGRFFHGKHTVSKIAAKTWRVTLTRTFQITKTETVQCALRSKSQNNKLLAADSRKYKVEPNGGGGNGGGWGKLSGSVKLLDKKFGKFKKRRVPVRFSIRSRTPRKVAWKLSCSNGRQWAGRTTLKKVGFKKYRSSMSRRFQVKKTETVSCTLQTRFPKRKLATASRKYVVAGKKPVAGGGGNLGNKPVTQGPIVNKPIVASVKPRCIGGRVFSTRKQPPQHICTCPSNKKRRKIGKRTFKCFPKFAKQKRPVKLVKKPRDLKKLQELRRKQQLKAKNRKALQKAAQKRRRQKAIANAKKKRQARIQALRKQKQKRALKVRPVTN